VTEISGSVHPLFEVLNDVVIKPGIEILALN